MKITKAKLVKGTFLKVSFSDGNAEIEKTYPHTEAPPRLLKAFFSLNSHLCNLTEQYDGNGVPDFDNIACRGYSTKGDDEKEGIVLTGVRSLSSGKVIVLNSPFSTLDITDSEYPLIKVLVEALDRCRDEIESFMDNNKSQDEIQGRLFNTPDENFILKSTPGEKTGTEGCVGILRDVRGYLSLVPQDVWQVHEQQHGLYPLLRYIHRRLPDILADAL